jgi:D-amino peptidase
MKVLICVDMEGVSGISSWEQVTDGTPYYEAARAWVLGETNAAVDGVLAGGGRDITVVDAHGSTRNILLDRLRPPARLVSGVPRAQGMMAGLDSSFTAALFVGFHAKARSRGVLAHTWSNCNVSVKLNDLEVGETGLNAALAGHHGVPVMLVTGDNELAAEARALLPHAEGVIVKKALSRFAAESLPHATACDTIRAAAERAVRNADKAPPLRIATPIAVEVIFQTPSFADAAEAVPGIRRVDPLRVDWTSSDMLEAFRVFRIVQTLAGVAGR